MDAGSHDRDLGAGTGTAGSGAIRAIVDRIRRPANRQAQLISSLNDVASAVSSMRSLDRLLETIVDRARQITDTDKAIIVLTGDHTAALDLESMVVRGRVGEHPQDEWEARLAGIGTRAFSAGGPLVEPDKDHAAWLMAAPIKVGDTPIGLLAAINSRDRRFSQHQMDYLAILAAFAATAIENARLAEMSRHVLLASERDRISREMHDGIAQSLFSVSLGLEVCRKQVIANPKLAAGRLDALQEQLNVARTELRRFIYDLRPIRLSELGLAGAIDCWIRELTFDKDIVGRLEILGDPNLITPAQETCLYRVTKEAVSNVVRHAEASAFTVTVACSPDGVRLVVEDDGKGFDTARLTDEPRSGFGLGSMRERVARERGRLTMTSEVGHGSVLEIELPMESD